MGRVRTLTSKIDTNSPSPRRAGGFTLLELVVALVILSILAASVLPSIERLSESMRYHSTVRELVLSAREAKRKARALGMPVDLLVDTSTKRFVLTASPASEDFSRSIAIPEELEVDVTYAREVSPDNKTAAIRFYPEGGATGGEIVITRPSGAGVKLTIDWLLSDVEQQTVTVR